MRLDDRAMKIIMVHNYYPVIGGGEDSVVDEERGMLERAGHTVVPFFMYTRERGLLDFLFSALCLIWNPVSYRRLRRVLNAERPDVVHCHNTFPLISPSVYWACAKAGVPVVQTLHNYRLICANGLFLRQGSVCEACSGKSFAWPAIRYRCYRDSLCGSLLLVMMQWVHRVLGTWRGKVDRYIVLTDFAESRFVESGVVDQKQLCVKPNFVEDRDSGLSPANRKRQAVFVGRLWPEKGSLLLVEAWMDAFQQNPNLNGYELCVVGDGPEREQAEALCNGHPEQYAIRFMGKIPRKEVLDVVRESRFLVLPSIWYEGFPMTIVEAFSCGTPILAARLGSMVSIVEDQKTGLFFEVADKKQLAERILWAVAHKERLEEMGRNARRQYEEHYTQDANYNALLSIYSDL